jgi:rod shape-determining protein MreD
MSRDQQATLITLGLMGIAVVLNSTVLRVIAIGGVTPDLVLILLVFLAVRRGSMSGQVAGFTIGVVEDLASLAPLGFHALLRTLLGFAAGRLHGYLFLDPVLMPFLLVVAVGIIKGLLAAAAAAAFAVPTDFGVLGGVFWIEVAYTGALAPPLFLLLSRLRLLRPSKRQVVR